MTPAKTRTCLVSFQTRAPVNDGFGHNYTWAETFQAWVSITPNRSRETFVSGSRETQVTHVIRGDWIELQAVKAEMRAVYAEDHQYPASGTSVRYFDLAAPMHDDADHADTMIKAREVDEGYGA